MTTFTPPRYATTRTAQQILAELGDVPHGDRGWDWKATADEITAMHPGDRPYYLTPHQAAQILGCSRQSLSRYADAGLLAFVRPDDGGMRRYLTTSVYALAQTRAKTPARTLSGPD